MSNQGRMMLQHIWNRGIFIGFAGMAAAGKLNAPPRMTVKRRPAQADQGVDDLTRGCRGRKMRNGVSLILEPMNGTFDGVHESQIANARAAININCIKRPYRGCFQGKSRAQRMAKEYNG